MFNRINVKYYSPQSNRELPKQKELGLYHRGYPFSWKQPLTGHLDRWLAERLTCFLDIWIETLQPVLQFQPTYMKTQAYNKSFTVKTMNNSSYVQYSVDRWTLLPITTEHSGDTEVAVVSRHIISWRQEGTASLLDRQQSQNTTTYW